MSRSFTSTSHLIACGTTAIPTTGSIVFRFYPTWASNDSTAHAFIDQGSGTSQFSWQKYSDNSYYVGWYTPTTSDKRVITGTYSQTQNDWNTQALTWGSGTTTFYINAVVTGTPTTGATIPDLTGGGYTRTIGNYQAGGADCRSRMADVAIFNVVLTAAEVSAFHKGISPLSLRAGTLPTDFWALAGTQSPEPNSCGATSGTVTGATAADHYQYSGAGLTGGIVTGTATADNPQFAGGGLLVHPGLVGGVRG